jgi:hypothetical protein
MPLRNPRVFMPRCDAAFDEKSVPLWTRGDFTGVRIVCPVGLPRPVTTTP